ncbi:polysaccharide deacetylase family protein [Blastococcus mobilis]|uniref:Polysaccharide deacetylase n=1 Tax=Blastococcus mobilis TaxID=1938746 RepID=A0A238X1Q1_9ACTN|nr:polysaccharide deacetylase family protein [Blastococcus mobilis]SNR52551.1 Polysaccharide deacetylase [Blastococcus mobilis]
MSRSSRRGRGKRSPLRQVLVGVLAIPLSMLPMVAYGQFTPEGQLLAAQARVQIAPPSLPRLTDAQTARYEESAPSWSGKAAVLVYHGLGAGNGEQRFNVSVEAFAEQLAAMRAAGMNPITAAELAAARRGERELPPNAVMITFDDGRTDAFVWADPVLADAGWRATMFVITDEASRRGLYYEGWDTIADLAATGRWDIQSHTAGLHHEQPVAGGDRLPALTSLRPNETLAEYRERVSVDLDDSRRAIERHIGVEPVAFAYPFGAYGGDRTNDPRVQDVLAEVLATRFDVAFQQDVQDEVPLAGCGDSPLLTRRVEVGDWSGAQLLERLTQMVADTAPGGDCPAG